MSPDVQNKIHNLQFRLEQFTEQKKAKKYQLVGIAHAINNNTKSPVKFLYLEITFMYLALSEIFGIIYNHTCMFHSPVKNAQKVAQG